MFIGHYGPALALAPLGRKTPLWSLFVAVQLVDYAWGGLVAAGVEKVRVEPGFTAMSPFDLYHMPYTHSLAASVLWALAAGLGWMLISRGGWRAFAVIALAVLSHWFADLLVHTPDLPLWPGGPKVGFGLWNSPGLTLALEGGLLAAGLAIYLRASRPKGPLGRVSPWLLVAALVAFEAVHLTGTPPTDPVVVGLTSIAAFSVLALIAALVDATRVLGRGASAQ